MSDFASMKIADLKKELKKSGLPTTGNKQELIERLQAAEGTSLLDENDDDLDQEDEEMTEEAIKEAEKELQVQGETSLSEETAEDKTKVSEEKENKISPEKVKVVAEKEEDPAEKIKARAERFGGFQSVEAKKAARAARFSDMMTEMKGNETNKKIGAAPAVDIDLLKKRAERFGAAVSPLVKEAEVSEAIKRRQDRFGVVAKDEPKPKKINLNAGVNSVLLDEKYKARAARFAAKKMASALDSLTATYTDSEGEEEKGSEEDEQLELAPGLAERLKFEGGTGTPGSGNSGRSTPKKHSLVSYQDPDAGLSDEDREPVPMDLESDEESKPENGENGSEEKEERSHIMEELWIGGVKLPPEPPGNCSRDLQEKIEKMWKRKVEEKTDLNYMIQNKKAFRNPSIYEKLILHLNIDELGTNFPPELYDGHLFGKESYYDELSKSQRAEMDKREKAAEAKKKMGDAKIKDALNTLQQRKSKWDQASSGPGVGVNPALAKVIPAFGSLKKK